jgi:glycosyltransferase involved in cell wall biosynthesis
MVRRIRLAVHYLGCARESGDGIFVPTSIGPLVECLSEAVESVAVVAFDSPSDGKSLEDLTDYEVHPANENVEFVSLGPKGSWKQYATRRRTVAERVAKRRDDWDVVIFRMVNRRAQLVFRALERPRIITILGGHTPSVIKQDKMRRRTKLVATLAASLAERQLEEILRASGLVVVNSEWLASIYRRVVPDLAVRPTSIRRARFCYVAPDRLTGANLNFLVSGRITPSKGVIDAVEAFARIRQAFPSARLHVVGAGDGVAAMRTRSDELGLSGDITFHGWLAGGPTLFDLYRRMDVLLMLSSAESLPRTIWEALAHSVLVISTPVGGIPLTFKHGEEMLFVRPDRPDDVLGAVRRLIEEADLRQSLMRRGYSRASESALDTIVADLLDMTVEKWPELREERDGSVGRSRM